jgi:hypothetical protein
MRELEPKPVADAMRSYNHRHTGAKRSCRSALQARIPRLTSAAGLVTPEIFVQLDLHAYR